MNITKSTKRDYKKKVRERYQNLSKEEKDKKGQYVRERYRDLPEDENKVWLNIRKNLKN